MEKMSTIKRACICAICIALCYVLPLAFHSLGIGTAFSPLHIPVLLCGLICGGFYGGFCGLAGPVLSSLLSGMPPVMGLVTMIPELVVYGVVSGLLMKWVRTGKLYLDVYISLGGAMLLGRIAGGIAKALFFAYLANGETFGIAMWVSSYIVGTLPGIVAHLVLIPILVITLMKAGVIPKRYVKTA
jgi:hypothetical protein